VVALRPDVGLGTWGDATQTPTRLTPPKVPQVGVEPTTFRLGGGCSIGPDLRRRAFGLPIHMEFPYGSVRSSPRRVTVWSPGGSREDPFPPALVPLASHGVFESLTPSDRKHVLAQHLFRYLDFATQLELVVVNDVLTRLALNPAYGLVGDQRLDAARMICDESYHALFSLDQTTKAFEVEYRKETPYFLSRLSALAEEMPTSYRELLKLLFVVVSETLISASLSEAASVKGAGGAVQSVMRDHARDEGRHHAFFAWYLEVLWASLSRDQRRWAGSMLPRLIDAFISPDRGAMERDLLDVGLSRSLAREAVEETWSAPALHNQCVDAAARTIGYFRAVGALDDLHVVSDLIDLGLV
jgi:hypothetical protein